MSPEPARLPRAVEGAARGDDPGVGEATRPGGAAFPARGGLGEERRRFVCGAEGFPRAGVGGLIAEGSPAIARLQTVFVRET